MFIAAKQFVSLYEIMVIKCEARAYVRKLQS